MTARLYLTGLVAVFIWRRRAAPSLIWILLGFYSSPQKSRSSKVQGWFNGSTQPTMACSLTHTHTCV